MAFTYNPTGFLSSSSGTSAMWSGQTALPYRILPTDTAAIATGDLVTIVGGYVSLYTSTLEGTAVPILGTFMGCTYQPVGSTYQIYFKSWPGANDVTPGTIVSAIVEDDPDLIFQAQSNSSAGLFITSNMKNTKIAFETPTALSISNGTSVMGVDTTGTAPVSGNATFSIKIVGVFDGSRGYTNANLNNWSTTGQNAVVVKYPILLCKINNHVYRTGTAGMA